MFNTIFEWFNQPPLYKNIRLLIPVLGALCLHWAINRLYTKISKALFKRRWILGYVVVRALVRPILVLLWVTPLTALFYYRVILSNLYLNQYVVHIVIGIKLLLFSWVGMRLIEGFRIWLLEQGRRELIPRQKVRRVISMLQGLLLLVISSNLLYIYQPLSKIELPETILLASKIGFIWLSLIIVIYLFYITLKEVFSILSMRKHLFVYSFLEIIIKPAILAIVGVALFFTLQYLDINLEQAGYNITLSDVFITAIFWAIYRSFTLFEEYFLQRNITSSSDKITIQGVGKIGRSFILLLGFLALLSNRQNISNIFNLISASAFLIGLSSKELIANYISGVALHLEGKFKTGDWIHSKDNSMEGFIENIGMRRTAVRTFDKRLMFIPNILFETEAIVSASSMTNRRIRETVSLTRTSYHAIEEITQSLRLLLQSHPSIDDSQPQMVHFIGFSTYGLNIEIYACTKTKDWRTYRNIQQELFLRTMEIIESHGGALAFPTKTVQVANEGYGIIE